MAAWKAGDVSKWGKWTPSGKTLKCPNCGYRLQVPLNPKDKIEPEPEPPSQLAKVGGELIFDKGMPAVLVPSWVKLRPVWRDGEKRIVIKAIGPTMAVTILTWVGAVVATQRLTWDLAAPWLVGLATICAVFPLSVVHYALAIDDDKPELIPAEAEPTEGDGESETEPVGDIAGWMATEKTEGGAMLRFYMPPRTPNGRYVRVPLVQRMAIEIVNAKAWVSERDMAQRGVPNGPYRLIRQDWLDRRWITALPDKTTVIEIAGRAMIGKIASTPPL